MLGWTLELLLAVVALVVLIAVLIVVLVVLVVLIADAVAFTPGPQPPPMFPLLCGRKIILHTDMKELNILSGLCLVPKKSRNM